MLIIKGIDWYFVDVVSNCWLKIKCYRDALVFGPKTWQYKESLCFNELTIAAGICHFGWHFWIVNEKLKRTDEKVLVGSAADIVFTGHG